MFFCKKEEGSICNKIAEICNKAQYDEASFVEQCTLRFHTLFCKSCAIHSTKNAKLTSLCKKANLQSLNEEDKRLMQEKLKSKLTLDDS